MPYKWEKVNIILGVIGADCHSVGNKILDHSFTLEHFNVINLGVLVDKEEFIEAALKYDAKAILVSSLYGQGEIDCEGLRELCKENNIEDIILYVGGNLVIGKTPEKEVKDKFISMGYDRVYFPDVDLHNVAEELKKDILARYKKDIYSIVSKGEN